MTQTAGDVDRDQALAAIDAERAAWDALVAEVGERRMDEPGPMGAWTFKDLAAHLTGWRARLVERLEAAAQGQPEPPVPWPAELEDDDAINAWIYERSRDRSAAEVLRAAADSWDRLRAAVAALPAEAIAAADYFPWTEGTPLGALITDRSFFGHLYEEHEPDVRAWLARAG